MCTVSYLPIIDGEHQFVVTHNRDESINRPADLPQVYKTDDTELFYPKDRRAGGTWIGVSDKQRLVCLMNGAFTAHHHQPPYRKSRGTVVKELLRFPEVLPAIKRYDFTGIEPFFALLFSWRNKLAIHEIVWDGEKLHLIEKETDKPQLWSAAMIYTKTEQLQRRQMFRDFLTDQRQNGLTAVEVWQFHHRRSTSREKGLIIDRGTLKTTSISQFIHLENAEDRFLFDDLHAGEKVQKTINWSKNSPD